ncbi:MAG TPA: 4'-phosphopantetheinyl transferase superfamily protein [Vicinamibacterales bacterium]|nr:4'-phosphopantetheinyl transferase superfamily protein [Vicinamibacterales bacterium]
MTAGDILVVWQSTAALTGNALADAVALLSDDERARLERIRFADAARDYAAAHALLRRVLSRGRATSPRDWRFARTPTGKPFLVDDAAPAMSFSLSHTRGLVACAVAPAAVAVGVDVEPCDREIDVDRLAARFFAESEVAALRARAGGERRDRFFDLWTLKEAVAKALGLELPPALAAVALEIDERPTGPDLRLVRSPTGADAAWQLALFTPIAGYRMAVAAVRPTGSPPLPISCSTSEILSTHPHST